MNKFIFLLILSFIFSTAGAQQTKVLTAKDYDRAESMLFFNTEALVDQGEVHPNWLSGDRLWYRILTSQGSEFILVDPAKGTRTPAFDHKKLSMAISSATGKNFDASHLPFTSFNFSDDNQFISFEAEGKQWKCDLKNYQCIAENSFKKKNLMVLITSLFLIC